MAAINHGFGMTEIYALTDPDGTIRYIGRGTPARKRYQAHLSGYTSHRVRRWVEGLKAKGQRPGLTILDSCSGDGVRLERTHIDAHAGSGNLLNIIDNECRPKYASAHDAAAHIHELLRLGNISVGEAIDRAFSEGIIEGFRRREEQSHR